MVIQKLMSMCLKTTVSFSSRLFVVLAALMLLATGCGWVRDNPLDRKGVNERRHKDSTPPVDMTVMADKEPDGRTVGSETITPWDIGGTSPDFGVTNCLASIIGKKCTKNGNECGKTNDCLMLDNTEGICTCACTPDDSKTPLVNEDNCPGQPKIVCPTKTFEVTSGGKKVKKNYCFKICQPKLGANDCTFPYVCHPASGSWLWAYGKALCFYSTTNRGCAKDSDCMVSTGARCSVKKKDCATGSKCEPFTTGNDPGLCVKAGVCDTASGLCKPQKTGKTAKVGDPCKGDVDCGDNMACLIEYHQANDLGMVAGGKTCKSDSDCCSGSCGSGTCDQGVPCTVIYRNGYCTVPACAFSSTLTHAKCPTGSVCNWLYSSGYCQKTCDLTKKGTCRGQKNDKMGDYECRNWTTLVLSSTGKKIADNPVCDFGPVFPCSAFKPPSGSTSTLSCAYLGTWSGTTKTNTTNMACRDMKNTKLTNKYDPKGWCFDDTASGSVAQ